MIKKIDIYVLRQVITPLLTTLGVAAMLLLLERMLRLFDMVANQGGPVGVVFRMLGNLIPQYLGIALPMAVFLGILLAFRKLSANAELESISASGLSLFRLMRAPLILSVLLSGFSVVLIGYIQPQSYYTYQNLLFDMSSGAFGASIRPGEYSDLGDGFTMRIGQSHDNGARLEEIFAQKERPDGHTTTITAREGRFLATPDGETILLRLADGVILDILPGNAPPRTFRFQQHDWRVGLPEVAEFRGRGAKERELLLHELYQEANRQIEPKDRLPYVAAFYDRIIRSLTILILPFTAVGLGVVSRRQQRSLGLVVGVVMLLGLHKVVEFGMASASLGALSIFLSMGVPLILYAALSGFFFYTTAYRVGVAPLAWLERGAEVIARLIQRFSFQRSDREAGAAGQ